MKRNLIFTVLFVSALGAGCAEDEIPKDNPSTPTAALEKAQTPDPVPSEGREKELRGQISDLEKRLQGMEARVVDLQAQLANKGKAGITTAVVGHPADGAGTAVTAAAVGGSVEAGFINDAPVQSYRKALIQLQAKQHPESILGFSAFLEKYPDHPLAGSAQFYLGEAYYAQREYKLALREYQRVLTSYDRSPRVADTLKQMAEIEDQIQKPREASRHRQTLTSLFPQSPAARVAMRNDGKTLVPATTQTVTPAAPLPAPAAETEAQTATEPTPRDFQTKPEAPAAVTPPGAQIDPPPTAPATAPAAPEGETTLQ